MSRLEFTNPTKRAALARSGGICECHRIPHIFETPCGQKLGDGNTFYEHIVCDALSPDNSLDNCAALTRNCWRYKTDSYDKPVIAKAKRNFDRANGIKAQGRKLPGGRFSNMKIRMNGQVVDRRTNLPWTR